MTGVLKGNGEEAGRERRPCVRTAVEPGGKLPQSMGQPGPQDAGPSPGAWRPMPTPWFWTSGLQNCERMDSVGASHSVCDNLLRQPQEIHTLYLHFIRNKSTYGVQANILFWLGGWMGISETASRWRPQTPTHQAWELQMGPALPSPAPFPFQLFSLSQNFLPHLCKFHFLLKVCAKHSVSPTCFFNCVCLIYLGHCSHFWVHLSLSYNFESSLKNEAVFMPSPHLQNSS